MRLQDLQQSSGERARSILTSALLIVLGVGGLLLMGHLAAPPRPAAPPPVVGQVATQTLVQAAAEAPVVEAPPKAVAKPLAADLLKDRVSRPDLKKTKPAPEPVSARPAPAPKPVAAEPVAPSELDAASWPPADGPAEPTNASTFVQRLQGAVLSLALISLLVWGVLRLLAPKLPAGLLPKAGGGRRRLLNVVERHSLAPGKGLYVVEVAGKHLLLGMTEHGITHLAELAVEPSEAEPVAEEAGAPTVTEAGAERPNLLQDVLARHLAAVPGISSRQQRGS